jgi:hypothetical protein
MLLLKVKSYIEKLNFDAFGESMSLQIFTLNYSK